MTYYAPPEGSYEDSHGYGLMSGALKLAFKKALSPEGVGMTELRQFGERGRAVHEPLNLETA
jgi:hypothetical protein